MLILEHWEYISSLGLAFLFGAWVEKMVIQWGGAEANGQDVENEPWVV